MQCVTQHAPDEAHVGELREPVRAPVAFVQHVQRFDVETELRGGINPFGDGRIKPVQTIQQQNLVRLQPHLPAAHAPAFHETINRFFNRLPVEQRPEVLIQQLNVQRFRRFVIPVIDPVGRMLDQRPEIVIKVEHQKTQALFFEPLRQLDRRGRLAGGTRTAHPHHPQTVAAVVQAGQDLRRSFVQRCLISRQRRGDYLLDAPAADRLIKAGHRVHALLAVPVKDLPYALARKAVAREMFLRNCSFPQPMPSPAITFVGIGGVLETVAAQRVQHLVLDGLNRRRKIRNQVMRVGVEADGGRVRQKTRDVFIRTLCAENLVVNARQKIPVKTADGFRGAQNGLADAVRIEFDQRPVALLNFDNAVLNWHHRELYRSRTNTQCRFDAGGGANSWGN